MDETQPLTSLAPTGSLRARLASSIVLIYALVMAGLLLALPLLIFSEGDSQQVSIYTRFSSLIPYLLSMVFVAAALLTVRFQHLGVAGQVFVLFAASVGATGMFAYYPLAPQALLILWKLTLPLAAAALLHLALIHPRAFDWVVRWPWVAYAGYPLALLLAVLRAPWQLAGLDPVNYPILLTSAEVWGLLIVIAALFIFIVMQGVRRWRTPSPMERQQSRILLWAALLAVAPAMAAYPLSNRDENWLWLLMSLSILPMALTYTLTSYRTVDSGRILNQATVYSILALFAGLAYALLVSGASLLVGEAVGPNNPILLGVMVFVLALAFDPVRRRVQTALGRAWTRGSGRLEEARFTFQAKAAQAVDTNYVVQLLRTTIEENLLPDRLHIYVYDPLLELYVPTVDGSGVPTTDIRFSPQSGLVHTLTHVRASLYLGERDSMPLDLHSERARLGLLGARLYVALLGQERVLGWLALGAPPDNKGYSEGDLAFLNGLAEPASRAIARAQVLADKDRRVHEMDVLTRVAQGVNVTLEFDDILELIYAQTRQVLALDDFIITLFNPQAAALRHAIYIESGSRVSNFEDRNLPEGQGLDGSVLESGHPILTDDYARACKDRNLGVDRQGVFAWMGIPLIAGEEAVGVISVASRDLNMLYTTEHRRILQAIADQAAGAIVKARLLGESQQRTLQLATLNEVAQSLTSTLDLDLLLQRILESAVDILNCEAGSLLLVDESTDELVFEAAVGSVGEELLGQRLAPGVGLVGKAVETRQPVIQNNVQADKDWFEETDEETGFITRGLLVVPMMVKDHVIGVIEVINRRDLHPFDRDDQDLLTAFTGQASIAAENARLYTLTDQALASRVDELSVMQRIDRELNTNLDVRRSMRITLDWALRQTEASAGLIGVVVEEGFTVMAAQGYDGLFLDGEEPIPLDLPAITRAMREKQAQLLVGRELESNQALLDAARSQLVIPIQREEDVVGLLVLESPEEDSFDHDTRAFLTRLTDHAAIAIANAQLYNAVRQANLVKSDFVSFVSHELKTPMTSIKGYADLLAAGAVGDISDAQSNFLSTIRTNVDRMATLVSDLADVSRIEAGRLQLEFRAIGLAETIEDVVRSTETIVGEKQHTLNVDLPADLPPVWGDRNRIIQVLTNLVSNASKYTPESGTLRIEAERSKNYWDPDGPAEVVHLWVADNGIGIKEEDQKNIFQQYFRTEEGKDTATGTGLGLNISRYLTEMQGGSIWFESEFGRGSTFHVTIPVAEVND